MSLLQSYERSSGTVYVCRPSLQTLPLLPFPVFYPMCSIGTSSQLLPNDFP